MPFDWIHQEAASQLSMALQEIIAVILGGAIGIERAASRRPAGVRTLAVLAGAAALLAAIGGAGAHLWQYASTQVIRADPVHIVEAIIVGVSFLGAGTIIQSKLGNVVGADHGRHNAARRRHWHCGRIGQLYLAVIVTVLAWVLLRAVKKVESY